MIEIVVVLDQDQYNRLVRKVGYNTGIDNNSTSEVIAYKLGVQHVLTQLREGFVVGTVKEPKQLSIWQKMKANIRSWYVKIK